MTSVSLVLFFIITINQFINPNFFGLFAVVSLGAPIIIIVNIILLAYWIIVWDKMAILLAVCFILFSGQVSRHLQIKIKKDKPYEKCDLRVMTYNVGVFNLWANTKKNSADSILTFINKQNPDILCMQEFRTTSKRDLNYISDALIKMPYRYVSYLSVTNRNSRNHGSGLAIYSKYRLIHGHRVKFKNSTNGLIYADMVRGRDTLRIINIHLQLSSVKTHEVYELDGSEDKELAKSIIRKLINNNSKRADQAKEVAELIANSPYKVLLCGDFNDTPASYTYHKIKKGFKDAFVLKGEGLGYTYNTMFHVLRIDNIFVDDDYYDILSYNSPALPFSDHNPIIVDLNKVEE
ncbi:MAG: endonuclease/exonuclease/phosphatase family protein [Rikenellaceae bacterium]